jgi:hypothetical protein
MLQKLPHTSVEPVKTTLKRFCTVVIFGIAFAYIEAAVVVYLRTIFHPSGFTFPLTEFGISSLWERLLLTEIGREAATLVLMLTGALLFGRTRRQQFAYFLAIFAVWDIFYYVWLKALLNWPSSIMDWDILFLMPVAWAGPVLAPVLISLTLFIFAIIILYGSSRGRPFKVSLTDWCGFILAGVVVAGSFCYAGLHIIESDFQSYFYWPVFAVGHIGAVALFLKCLLKSK